MFLVCLVVCLVQIHTLAEVLAVIVEINCVKSSKSEQILEARLFTFVYKVWRNACAVLLAFVF